MMGLIGPVGPWELILVLAILLIIVGPGKLPSVGKAIGKSLGEFKKAKTGEFEEMDHEEKIQ
ncbi:MAG: twin-arginine translocase TatA/TatE family subunit [Syntrophomonadaceae bacterium]|nr:twin-arginine translocase TatA/TatE family subunit [Syntrophomonadaceae bacterium]